MLKLLKLAGQVANINSDKYRKAFVGAIVIRSDGTLVSSRNGSTPSPDSRSPSCHAEYKALRKADKGATIYIARVKRDGNLALSKPCATCAAFICSKHVKAVYYTISNTEYGVYYP